MKIDTCFFSSLFNIHSVLCRKIISILIIFCFSYQQSGACQVVNPTVSASAGNIAFSIERFRPIHLRYLHCNPAEESFTILLDKGDFLSSNIKVEDTTLKLIEYFLIGLVLPDSVFWVDLHPDRNNRMLDPDLAKTDVGKILLETDLLLKKDVAKATSVDTPEGRQYWNELYQKANEIFGMEQEIEIPTAIRSWIVPGEIILCQSSTSTYICKATLKVVLEEDWFGQKNMSFTDRRIMAINKYSSELIRRLIIPKVTRLVNSDRRYAPLRQVYYSLILARWFKSQFKNKAVSLEKKISPAVLSLVEKVDSRDLEGLTSETSWSKDTYFDAYRQSLLYGEYNKQEEVMTAYGLMLQQYFSGGMDFRFPSSIVATSVDNIEQPMTGQPIIKVIKNDIWHIPVIGQKICPAKVKIDFSKEKPIFVSLPENYLFKRESQKENPLQTIKAKQRIVRPQDEFFLRENLDYKNKGFDGGNNKVYQARSSKKRSNFLFPLISLTNFGASDLYWIGQMLGLLQNPFTRIFSQGTSIAINYAFKKIFGGQAPHWLLIGFSNIFAPSILILTGFISTGVFPFVVIMAAANLIFYFMMNSNNLMLQRIGRSGLIGLALVSISMSIFGLMETISAVDSSNTTKEIFPANNTLFTNDSAQNTLQKPDVVVHPKPETVSTYIPENAPHQLYIDGSPHSHYSGIAVHGLPDEGYIKIVDAQGSVSFIPIQNQWEDRIPAYIFKNFEGQSVKFYICNKDYSVITPPDGWPLQIKSYAEQPLGEGDLKRSFYTGEHSGLNQQQSSVANKPNGSIQAPIGIGVTNVSFADHPPATVSGFLDTNSLVKMLTVAFSSATGSAVATAVSQKSLSVLKGKWVFVVGLLAVVLWLLEPLYAWVFGISAFLTYLVLKILINTRKVNGFKIVPEEIDKENRQNTFSNKSSPRVKPTDRGKNISSADKMSSPEEEMFTSEADMLREPLEYTPPLLFEKWQNELNRSKDIFRQNQMPTILNIAKQLLNYPIFSVDNLNEKTKIEEGIKFMRRFSNLSTQTVNILLDEWQRNGLSQDDKERFMYGLLYLRKIAEYSNEAEYGLQLIAMGIAMTTYYYPVGDIKELFMPPLRILWGIRYGLKQAEKGFFEQLKKVVEIGNELEPNLYQDPEKQKEQLRNYFRSLYVGKTQEIVLRVQDAFGGMREMLTRFLPLMIFFLPFVSHLLFLVGLPLGAPLNIANVIAAAVTGIGISIGISWWTIRDSLVSKFYNNQKEIFKKLDKDIQRNALQSGMKIDDLKKPALLNKEYRLSKEALEKEVFSKQPSADAIFVLTGNNPKNKEHLQSIIHSLEQEEIIRHKDVPVFFVPSKGEGSGNAFIDFYAYKHSEEFRRLIQQHPRLRTIPPEQMRSIVLLAHKPNMVDKESLRLALMNGYKGTQELQARNRRGAEVILFTDGLYIGRISPVGDITLLSCWMNKKQISEQEFGLFLADVRGSGFIRKFYEKMDFATIKNKLEQATLRRYFDWDNNEKEQFLGFAGGMVVSFQNADRYSRFIALCKQVKEYTENNKPSYPVSLALDILVPFVMLANNERITTFLGAVHDDGNGFEVSDDEHNFYRNLFKLYRNIYDKGQPFSIRTYVPVPAEAWYVRKQQSKFAKDRIASIKEIADFSLPVVARDSLPKEKFQAKKAPLEKTSFSADKITEEESYNLPFKPGKQQRLELIRNFFLTEENMSKNFSIQQILQLIFIPLVGQQMCPSYSTVYGDLEKLVGEGFLQKVKAVDSQGQMRNYYSLKESYLSSSKDGGVPGTNVGGIDFRNLSIKNINSESTGCYGEIFDIQDWQQLFQDERGRKIQQMLNSLILPDSEIIIDYLEFIQCHRGSKEFIRIAQFLVLEMMRIEEEFALPTSPLCQQIFQKIEGISSFYQRKVTFAHYRFF
ncbi:MAG: hypothetical protein N2606_06840 [Candidatus Omnitrophica bacterium]|nr:hypothetical protein [Candidatus Omnitrophota bacterium]